ncbi:squalene/phytoene synthase family protein [Luteolibacter yonseiensis]|uniref:Squalene/phytoene synthase family protein n=1 Tax=Luteolibacter yonseiensis TaxID=1144680 RepID=A0A934VC48_9BACT|nr:squalene/phytoene synthase family protein [Luteolibacter yonseiensis]MBK1816114.1 squalene/phytoene synthase family protein [Luteolibacter yonseiensis]
MSAASEITRKAKSNLAFALKILPRDRREDMVVFYAFCRTMDDLADDPGMPAEQRLKSLDAWENGITRGFDAPDEFQQQVVSLRDRRQIPDHLLVAIIDGCRMDLQPRRFATWEDLSGYIWKVSCAVGLVSIRIFGCVDTGSERYAIALGHALQLTNILRDVGEDYENGRRIYLPMEDLERFHYTEQDLAARVRDTRFLALMDHQAARAEEHYREAAASLPARDRKALLPASIMGEIYYLLLNKMRAGRFHVFGNRYRISKARKLVILSKHLIARSR